VAYGNGNLRTEESSKPACLSILVQGTPQYTRALPLTVCYPQWLRATTVQLSLLLSESLHRRTARKQCYHTVTALQFFCNERQVR